MAITVDAGEFELDELMARLKDGERVIVRTEFLGDIREVALRFDGETFYCDTPTRLHKHAEEAEMRACIERQGYAASGET
ncbi:hypothetical protein [Halorarius litoreus]|uniref:hypothetical protein n=1 Tax=Halorarius litoreus TaxID=2962676 RepID=UPI0020CD3732|nr:hypothetical protein [Halorarius litoreus]